MIKHTQHWRDKMGKKPKKTVHAHILTEGEWGPKGLTKVTRVVATFSNKGPDELRLQVTQGVQYRITTLKRDLFSTKATIAWASIMGLEGKELKLSGAIANYLLTWVNDIMR